MYWLRRHTFLACQCWCSFCMLYEATDQGFAFCYQLNISLSNSHLNKPVTLFWSIKFDSSVNWNQVTVCRCSTLFSNITIINRETVSIHENIRTSFFHLFLNVKTFILLKKIKNEFYVCLIKMTSFDLRSFFSVVVTFFFQSTMCLQCYTSCDPYVNWSAALCGTNRWNASTE